MPPTLEKTVLAATTSEQAEFAELEAVRAQRRRLSIYGQQSSLNAHDGSRNRIYPADVHGRFASMRRVTFVVLIGLWAILPWLRVHDRPALFLNIEARQFFLFGWSFNAQDFWLTFFLLISIALTLVVVTTIWGRVWCGWACPQTVFLEGFYRPIERWIEGPRNERLRRDLQPMSAAKFARKSVKHTLYLAMSFFIAHMFLAYFVSLPSLLTMMQHRPNTHATAFSWAMVLTAILYANFAWFREQMCLVICPYGRLQSALTDDRTLVVGYDAVRGEPRGKGAKRTDKGDCVDCGRCVAACPTGIDIRNGLQIDCIACTQCIDACDEIMGKLGKPRGLVRYDSFRGLHHQARGSGVRPRLLFYAALALALLTGGALSLRQRHPFAANLLRVRGAPYVVEQGDVRNTFDLHVVNRADKRVTFELSGHIFCRVGSGDEVCGNLAMENVLVLPALAHAHVTVVARVSRAETATGARVEVRVATVPPADAIVLRAPLLGPHALP